MTKIRQSIIQRSAVCLLFFSGIAANAFAGDDEFKIEKAKWKAEESRLTIKGEGEDERTVTVTNAETSALIGTDSVDDDEWRVRDRNPASVPCRVRAEQSDGQSDERDVEDAPADCVEAPSLPLMETRTTRI